MTTAEWANDARGRRASERYRQLLHELGSELRNRYGWKAAVARRLGVHPSYISKVIQGEVVQIGHEMIDRAVERLGLDARYFIDPTDSSYHDFATGTRTPVDADEGGIHDAERMWRVLARRANAVREAEAEKAPASRKLQKARDIAQAVLASRLVQAAQAIAASDDPELAWRHAQRIASQAEAEEMLIDTWRVVQRATRSSQG